MDIVIGNRIVNLWSLGVYDLPLSHIIVLNKQTQFKTIIVEPWYLT